MHFGVDNVVGLQPSASAHSVVGSAMVTLPSSLQQRSLALIDLFAFFVFFEACGVPLLLVISSLALLLVMIDHAFA